MILIYTDTSSPRLLYISHFLFRELMGIDATVITDAEYFKNYDGAKINYSNNIFDNAVFNIPPGSNILFETGVQAQNINCFETNGHKAFFKPEGKTDLPFDILAATFYLLTRYEEYLPHGKDEFGRYAHTNSIAFKEDFLQLPLINIWANEFIKILQQQFPSLTFHKQPFKFQPTYDIDMAYSYKHKGIRRNIGSFLRSPSFERISVLWFGKKDPFDTYQWMNELHEKYALKPVYFFLVAAKNGKYDKNILLYKNIMWRLIKFHGSKYSIGLHPSWQSGDEPSLLAKEKEYLESMSDVSIKSSRQHYIRFELPATYRRLINIGITAEYSMGYGSINGFRASIASPYYWYDLEKDEQTFLRVHPFCFMDANSFYEQHLSPAQAYDELIHYYNICKAHGGTLTTIWHNNFLGTGKAFAGWKAVYEKFIAQLQQ